MVLRGTLPKVTVYLTDPSILLDLRTLLTALFGCTPGAATTRIFALRRSGVALISRHHVPGARGPAKAAMELREVLKFLAARQQQSAVSSSLCASLDETSRRVLAGDHGLQLELGRFRASLDPATLALLLSGYTAAPCPRLVRFDPLCGLSLSEWLRQHQGLAASESTYDESFSLLRHACLSGVSEPEFHRLLEQGVQARRELQRSAFRASEDAKQRSLERLKLEGAAEQRSSKLAMEALKMEEAAKKRSSKLSSDRLKNEALFRRLESEERIARINLEIALSQAKKPRKPSRELKGPAISAFRRATRGTVHAGTLATTCWECGEFRACLPSARIFVPADGGLPRVLCPPCAKQGSTECSDGLWLPGYESSLQREAAWVRSAGLRYVDECRACEEPVTYQNHQYCHNVAESKGGLLTAENGRNGCGSCNRGADTHVFDDYCSQKRGVPQEHLPPLLAAEDALQVAEWLLGKRAELPGGVLTREQVLGGGGEGLPECLRGRRNGGLFRVKEEGGEGVVA